MSCGTAGNTFSITCDGGASVSELVKRGKYNWVNDSITDKLFPIEKHARGSRTIELVEFDYDPTSEEVLDEFSRRDLERPTLEDALCFGIEHPEEQRKHPIAFLHEPVQGPRGYREVLLVLGHAGGRSLDRFLWFGGGWARVYVFAAVRK